MHDHFAVFILDKVVERARQNIGDLLVIVRVRIDIVDGLEADELERRPGSKNDLALDATAGTCLIVGQLDTHAASLVTRFDVT